MAKTTSGHEAGKEFARRVGITQQWQIDNYSGNSQSFKEGMQEYLDELLAKQNSPQATLNPNQINNAK